MNDFRNLPRAHLLEPPVDSNKRLVTFQAEKTEPTQTIHHENLQQIRKKYAIRRHNLLPVQNPQPAPNVENTDLDRDDSPINWISKLGPTPESSPNPIPPPQQSSSVSKLIRHQRTVSKPLQPSKLDQIEKIDQINIRIKSILQNLKEGQSNQQSLLKLNPNSINVNSSLATASTIVKTSYTNIRRQDSENRCPDSPKNARSKSKTIKSDIFTKEPAAAELNYKMQNKQSQWYSSINKEQLMNRERRVSFGDLGKLSIPLQKHEPGKLKFMNHRGSVDENAFPALSARVSTDNSELQKLIKLLKKQVELDKLLRNRKYAYSEIKDKHKFQLIVSTLTRIGARFNKDTLAKELQVTQAEFNPFYKPGQGSDIEQIAHSYKTAQDHWETNISKKFTKEKLLESGIKHELLFVDKKGMLAVEDLVRLLSDELECSLRNRDLILIFRRVSVGNELKFDDFMRALCHD